MRLRLPSPKGVLALLISFCIFCEPAAQGAAAFTFLGSAPTSAAYSSPSEKEAVVESLGWFLSSIERRVGVLSRRDPAATALRIGRYLANYYLVEPALQAAATAGTVTYKQASKEIKQGRATIVNGYFRPSSYDAFFAFVNRPIYLQPLPGRVPLRQNVPPTSPRGGRDRGSNEPLPSFRDVQRAS